MLLAIDIGNSSSKFGIFDGENLASKFSIPTNRNAGASNVSDAIAGRLNETPTAAIVASVVPEAEQAIREYLQLEHNIDPVFVDHSFDFGLKIKYEPITAAGIDRLVNASAAATKYGTPIIVCSFGTATTIDAVNAASEYLGGVIAPGIRTMAKALHLSTSKLPEVEIEKPDKVLGNSTEGAIRSGIFYGYMGLVEGLIKRVRSQSGMADARLVATGGFATVVADESDFIDTIDENLTLEGIRRLRA